MKEIELLSGKSKEIEREIVSFYKTVGRMVSLNPRATEIFAYLKVYDALTQEQLKRLTGFSLSTISTTLRAFLHADIIGRKMIPGTHKNIYSISPERANFVYTPSTQILEDLEKLESYILERQSELKELQDKHPIEAEFLHRRLNSLRNYIEVQRRTITKQKKHDFFQEDVSELLPLNEMIDYPFETREIEENVMDILGYYKDDPIKNRIRGIFYTRRSVTQQVLIDISGFSRSTVSRLLRQELEREYIGVLPREYRRPRVYYLESISLTILSFILNTDAFIFSYVSRFQEILSNLQTGRQSDGDGKDVTFLIAKIGEVIEQIETFRNDTRYMRKAHHDLLAFLGRDARVST